MPKKFYSGQIAVAIDHLATHKDIIEYHSSPTKSLGDRIRETARRKGINVSAIKKSFGYEVTYIKKLPPSVKKKSVSSKTKRNTKHQSSKRTDHTPENSMDPTHKGATLRELILKAKSMGGGKFETQCNEARIKKVAEECDTKYKVTSKSKDTTRTVTI